ncbi:MAG: TauD/TfdA family dioxygenase [Alphaproteobacteria bacterium]|nr:TauD/TfdA family dioxygenase [Alphaproteobacteria bacterium]
MTEIIRERITAPDAWVGPDIQKDNRWLHTLTADEIAEIDTALQAVKSARLEIPFGADAFPIPTFKARLDELISRVTDGLGVILIRGIPRERYTNDECGLIYWGLGVHMGRPVSQNSRGHLLGNVTDEGKTLDDPDARGYQTKNRLDFHCDQLPVDLLGLFCLRTAKSGGTSYLVSAPAVHNVLLDERPDLLDVLYAPFHVDWRGDHPDGEQPWYDVPMLTAHDGRIAARVTNRSFMESVSRYGEELTLSEAQREALDVFQEISNREELRLKMDFQEGDMQFINNHSILHARQAYEDHDEPDRKRRLLRMWIGMTDHRRRQLAPILAERYRYVETGGIPKTREAA